MTGVIRRPCEDKQRRRPCEDRDRDGSGVFRNQETPRIAGNHQKLGEKHEKVSPSELPEGTNLTNALIQTSSIQNQEKINFCCLKTPSVVLHCYGSPRKLLYLLNENMQYKHILYSV